MCILNKIVTQREQQHIVNVHSSISSLGITQNHFFIFMVTIHATQILTPANTPLKTQQHSLTSPQPAVNVPPCNTAAQPPSLFPTYLSYLTVFAST